MLNHKGITLPVVLGMIILIMGLVVVTSTVVYRQAISIEADFNAHESYVNAQSRISAANQMIIRDQDTSDLYLADLGNYLNVDITLFDTNIYLISANTLSDTIVKSYLTLSGVSNQVTLTEDLLQNTGIEPDFVFNPFLEPAIILSNYLQLFMNETYPSIPYNESFTNFNDIFSYYETLALNNDRYTYITARNFEKQKNYTVNKNLFISGNLSLKNGAELVVPDGYFLFIDGRLTLGENTLVSGNIAVNGDFNMKTSRGGSALETTIYASGGMSFDSELILGTPYRPTFLLADGTVAFKDSASYYGYVLADKVTFKNTNAIYDIYGGMYAPAVENLDPWEITAYYDVDTLDIVDFAIADFVTIPSEDGGVSQTIIYTDPK